MADDWEYDSGGEHSQFAPEKDLGSLLNLRSSDGYRDGVIEGKEKAIQKSFDIGYKLVTQFGREIGQLEGKLMAVIDENTKVLGSTSKLTNQLQRLLRFVRGDLNARVIVEVSELKYQIPKMTTCKKCGMVSWKDEFGVGAVTFGGGDNDASEIINEKDENLGGNAGGASKGITVDMDDVTSRGATYDGGGVRSELLNDSGSVRSMDITLLTSDLREINVGHISNTKSSEIISHDEGDRNLNDRQQDALFGIDVSLNINNKTRDIQETSKLKHSSNAVLEKESGTTTMKNNANFGLHCGAAFDVKVTGPKYLLKNITQCCDVVEFPSLSKEILKTERDIDDLLTSFHKNQSTE